MTDDDELLRSIQSEDDFNALDDETKQRLMKTEASDGGGTGETGAG